MELNKYQEVARSTAIYPNVGNNLWYPTLGLCGESGEVAEKVKKIYRDKSGQLDHDTKNLLIRELGDVLWYVANIASEIKIDLDKIAKVNLVKLSLRKEQDKIHGDGDNR